MINLLPPTEKYTLIKEFDRRLLSVYIIVLGTVFLISLVILLPSFFLTNVIEVIALEERSILIHSTESNVREEINERLRLTKEHLTVFTLEELRAPLFSVIDEMVRLSGIEVTINSIIYTRRFGSKDSSLIITGGALTRDGLLSFTQRLEENELISEAILPVSSLAKDRDISFSIEILGKF